MTLVKAVARAHAIQADVEAGRLDVNLVRRELDDLVAVFAEHGQTPERARAVVALINAGPAPVAEPAELPW